MRTVKNITVRELDILHCNESIDSSDTRLTKIDKQVFNELTSFVNEFNESEINSV